MDSKTLITIVVTAIIAAFVKEIVASLLPVVKKPFKNSTITAKLRNAITANRVFTVSNLGLLAWVGWRVFKFIADPSPVTRLAIFDMVYSCFIASLIRIMSWNQTDTTPA
jgi:hypothetical protein